METEKGAGYSYRLWINELFQNNVTRMLFMTLRYTFFVAFSLITDANSRVILTAIIITLATIILSNEILFVGP